MKKLITIIIALIILPGWLSAQHDRYSGNVHLRGNQDNIRGQKTFLDAVFFSDSVKLGINVELLLDDDGNTYLICSANDVWRLFTGGVQAWVVGNNGFQVNRDIVGDSILTIAGESNLGDELTDTTTFYRSSVKGSMRFDSLAVGTKYLDFSQADSASSTTYFWYMNSTNYATTSNVYKFTYVDIITLGMGTYPIKFGGTYAASDNTCYQLKYQNSDDNARVFGLFMPQGGINNVPLFVIGDTSAIGKDLGFFNGYTQPGVALIDDDADSWGMLTHYADDIPGIKIGGAAKSLTLPNALTLQLHTIAAGDSVVFNHIVDVTDSTLKYYDGTSWIEYYRQGGTDVPLLDGGTNASLTASNGGIVYSSATALGILAGTATANQIVMSGASTTPAWSTSTYPSTILQGDFLYGTNFSEVGKLAWTGAGNYIVSAADSAWTTAALLTDAVAGDGLGGGSDNVLLGSDVDITFAALLDFDGGLETVDDSINIKLDGGSLTVGATGISVTIPYDTTTYGATQYWVTTSYQQDADTSGFDASKYYVNTMIGDSIANTLGDLSAQIGATLKDSLNFDTKTEWEAILSDGEDPIFASEINSESEIETIVGVDWLLKADSALYATVTALDEATIFRLDEDETVSGEITFSADSLKLSADQAQIAADSVLNLYTFDNSGFVEITRSTTNAGILNLGRTTGTEASALGICDGGANKPGYLQLLNENGSGMYFWTDSLNQLRVNAGAYTNPDVDGYAVVDLDNGNLFGAAVTATSYVIGANSLTTMEWANLDGQDQTVLSTSSPTFNTLTLTAFKMNEAGAIAGVADQIWVNGDTMFYHDGATVHYWLKTGDR